MARRLLSNGTLTRKLTESSLSPRHRSKSNRSGGDSPHPQLIEIDLDSSSSASSGIMKLEDVIDTIIVRRSAPDWLPFLPGHSYWVPPRSRRPHLRLDHHHHHPRGVIDAFEKICASKAHHPLSEDEMMSAACLRGWPSSSYYIQGSAPTYPIPMEVVEVEAKLQDSSDNESKSDDKE